MDKIVKTIKASGKNTKQDDDLIDRLSSRYTVIIIVTFAIVVSGQQYFIGKPLNCWEPKHFTGSHRKYMNAFCWVNNTYYLPFEERVMGSDGKILPYYQWIPFILLGQAFFFYLPSFFWHGLNQKAGVDSDDILKTAHKISNAKDSGTRQKLIDFLTTQIDIFLIKGKRKPPPDDSTLLLKRRRRSSSTSDFSSVSQQNRGHSDTKCLLGFIGRIFSGRFSAYLLTIFLVSKVLYALNVFGQIFALSSILGISYKNFGIEFLTGGSKNNFGESSLSSAFPKVTMCNFLVRRLGNVHEYNVQCVLPINMYNEIIYVFLWFWFLIVGILTILSLIFWLARSLLRCDKVKYVMNHITFDVNQNGRIFNRFLDDYLGQDGIFLIRLIGHNCNFITTNDITTALWKKYEERNIIPEQEGYARSEV